MKPPIVMPPDDGKPIWHFDGEQTWRLVYDGGQLREMNDEEWKRFHTHFHDRNNHHRTRAK